MTLLETDEQPRLALLHIPRDKVLYFPLILWRNHIVRWSCPPTVADAGADLPVIFQIGSSDPELALQAAKIVQQDVAGM
jgi:tRNA-dihydrouridine synthase